MPAFAEALKTHPNLKLKIGGGGYEEAKLHQLAKDLGLQNSVTFLGKLKSNEVLDLMYHSDAFVLASRHETFGVVFIEALAQGLPVIATRCGGPESIVNEDNGLIVNIEDRQALTDALITLYEHRHQYDAKSLREHALKEFSGDAVISQIKDIYQTVTQ